MSEVKQDQPRTFWLQQGSFRTVVVDSDTANPEWGRKPFRVIEIFAIEQLQQKLTASEARVRELEAQIDSPYCPVCQSCGEDGCCAAERCLYPSVKEDAVKVAKEIADEVCLENEVLKAKLQKAVEALEFYADQDNYTAYQNFKEQKNVIVLTEESVSDIARATLKEIGVES